MSRKQPDWTDDFIAAFWAGYYPVALPVFLYFTRHDVRQRLIWRRAKAKVALTPEEKTTLRLMGV